MSTIPSLTVETWNQEVLKSSALTLVYFWHERCSWCARLSPVLDEVRTEFAEKIRFLKLNVLEHPENQELASTYGVMGTPTLMFFCQGRSIGQIVSYMPKEELEQALNQMLQRYRACLTQSSDLHNYVV